MPLTPEDVVSKRFNSTKFREGYDQDEVDDFLDEVVVELRRLNAENDELKQRLIASEARINELQRGGASASAAEPPATVAAPIPAVAAEPEPAPVGEPEPVVEPEPVAAVAPEPAPVDATPVSAPAEPDPETTSTNDLLKLARRLHDQHVQEGIDKRDELIAEGHSTAAKLVSDAQEQSTQQLAALEEQKSGILAQIEEQKTTVLGALEEQKTQLEGSIEQLRGFETEYRAKLKSYIEGQLEELNSSGDSVAPSAPASSDDDTASTSGPPSSPTPFAAAGAPGAAPQRADSTGFAGNA